MRWFYNLVSQANISDRIRKNSSQWTQRQYQRQEAMWPPLARRLARHACTWHEPNLAGKFMRNRSDIKPKKAAVASCPFGALPATFFVHDLTVSSLYSRSGQFQRPEELLPPLPRLEDLFITHARGTDRPSRVPCKHRTLKPGSTTE